MRKHLIRLWSAIWLVSITLGAWTVVLAKNDPFDIGVPKAPEPKAFVPQYFIVGMLVALGMFLVCKPAKRDPEIPHEYQASGAEKDVKNL